MSFFKERIVYPRSAKSCSCCDRLIPRLDRAVYQVGKGDFGFNYGYMRIACRIELGDRYGWDELPGLREDQA